VDVEGRLLGLNALRLEGGLILAVPASVAVKQRAEGLARGEAPSAPRLGVAVAPPRAARRMRRAVGLPERDGLLVRAVEDGSPAAAAGLEPGDLLVAAGDTELGGVDALYEVLDALPAGGGALALTVVRGTEERRVDVEFRTTEAAA
jgi:S1-C subfamily serine protease